ncbi:MAG: SUMF1/EgtB/PvdO family nonheme iron enzyme [Phycisphaerae bacterium]|nr:SUMF1/EgtB/PvdO family nonheme iron enzyme [Phycisphaerae bacterium]
MDVAHVAMNGHGRRGLYLERSLFAALLLCLAADKTTADVLNMPPGLTSVEFVHVGHAGNPSRLSGAGAGGSGSDAVVGGVDYEFRMGTFEVTAAQYTEFLNAVASTSAYGLYVENMGSLGGSRSPRIIRSGVPGSFSYSVAPDYANRPVVFVSWLNAARFANWLTNGQPSGLPSAETTEDGSYDLTGVNGIDGFAIAMAVTRRPGAKFVIPSEDEWYKAAYHANNGVTGDFWDYPTRSNTMPGNGLFSPDTGNSANYFNGASGGFTLGSPYYRSEVGEFENSGSAYGTFDQGGNVAEWNESVYQHPQVGPLRGIRGGSYWSDGPIMQAAWRNGLGPGNTLDTVGFRMAWVPEPGAIALLVVAGALLHFRTSRRR